MTTHPSAGARDWGGRLPRNETLALDDEQRAAVDRIRSGTARWAEESGFAATDDEGGLIGPFNAFVLRPRPGAAFNRWVATDRQESSLPATVREVVILTVGAAWGAAYELYAHTAVARSVGLAENAVQALLDGTAAQVLTGDELVVHRFVDELVGTHRVSDGTYAAAEAALGRDGMLDTVHLTGMYLSVSALLNAFEIPAPEIPPAP
ncbi:carboxymuconolactone decarboxylase family protein [Pseudonocardia alni]|uniref:carboxymuconolactone decarboxylase family protein n=1 Tax=Pseudonocardia alni TaxID=33907 RepID=UPI003405CCBB